MPERPDLDYVLPILDRELRGRTVSAVQVRKPVVLRLAVPGTPAELLVGRRIGGVTRRAHFAQFRMGGADPQLDLVVAPMLAGRFALVAAGERAPRDLALTLALDDGRELRYRDDVQMGKVYVVPRGEHDAIAGFADVGVDVLDPAAFTLERFRELAKSRRDQVKVFLMDKSALDSFGNAYADEALFEAGVHPKTFVRTLGDDDLVRLHRAIPEVLGRAARIIAERKPPLDEKVRDFLNVRNKHKQPCPRCGTAIRKAGVHGHDAFFCPTCQPETRKGSIVSWSRPTVRPAGAPGSGEPPRAGPPRSSRRRP